MHRPRAGWFAVPGARLYYEVRGAGPPLLIIPTGNGDATPFWLVADELADRYTVLTYDRRGFSRSVVESAVPDKARLAEDVRDAHRLLRHLAAAPAQVYASCSGGIVGLELLARHPHDVATMVVHEAPVSYVLPDAAYWLKFHVDLYRTYREHGVEIARDAFAEGVRMTTPTRPPGGAQLPQAQLDELMERLRRNQIYWFEHELRPYSAFAPDLVALRAAADRLVLAGGRTSRQHLGYRASAALAGLLGVAMVELPGGHVSHVTHPFDFAEALDRLLRTKAQVREQARLHEQTR